jgi:hypothetical protein
MFHFIFGIKISTEKKTNVSCFDWSHIRDSFPIGFFPFILIFGLNDDSLQVITSSRKLQFLLYSEKMSANISITEKTDKNSVFLQKQNSINIENGEKTIDHFFNNCSQTFFVDSIR